jgi:hypothetical protein
MKKKKERLSPLYSEEEEGGASPATVSAADDNSCASSRRVSFLLHSVFSFPFIGMQNVIHVLQPMNNWLVTVLCTLTDQLSF